MTRETAKFAQKYIDKALEMGATDAVFFDASQICWDSANRRSRFLSMYPPKISAN